ncbi:Evolutionarily conserved signaling intermediate in Toll pathway, mitochondrial [Halotydeus destructor]|nr:Evolutionarily conserved signaling intermediate in Toll pathway, mitochondrial [Halotydeus destructor]
MSARIGCLNSLVISKVFRRPSYSVCRSRCLHITSSKLIWPKKEKPYEVKDDRDRKIGEPKFAAVEMKDVMVASEDFQRADKTKDSFLDTIEDYTKTVNKHRSGQVEFIYAALRVMKDFGVHKDLEAYKSLIDVFPKERMKPTNTFQAGFYHYGKQQACALKVLDEMEYYNIMPDAEMEQLVISTFSKHSYVWRKVARQLYWMSKFKNANPYPLPENVPMDALELAKIALKRMCPDLQTKIAVWATGQISDSLDKTWIVSAQSVSQKELIEEMKPHQPLYVEGSYRVWLRDKSISYFVLRADNPESLRRSGQEEDDDPYDVSNIPINMYGRSKEKALTQQKAIHQQPDGTYLAICATGTSSRDSLLSWIRLLEGANRNLQNLQVIFNQRAPQTSLSTLNEEVSEKDRSEDINAASEESPEKAAQQPNEETVKS